MSLRKNAILWIVSTLVLVVGFALGVVGVGQNDQLVKKLVRTPAGCASTVRVDNAGTYYVYIETRGRVASLDGCDNETRTYDLDEAPSVDVRVFDASDQLLDQSRDDSVSYDTPAGAGDSIASIDIDEPGRFVIEVRSDDPSAVVAFGRSAAIEANRMVLSAAAVVMLGGLLMLISLIATVRRRRRARGSAAVVVYGSDSPTVTWAPPRPEDRAWSVRDDAEQ